MGFLIDTIRKDLDLTELAASLEEEFSTLLD